MSQALRFSLSLILCALVLAQVQSPADAQTNAKLRLTWQNGAAERLLGDFLVAEFPPASKKKSKERDPKTGEVVTWEGVSLNWLLDHGMERLTVQEKAAIDLVILVGKTGKRAMIPRGILSRNPLILAYRRSGKEIDDRGPLYSVVPWSTSTKLNSEPLPLESYFVPAVERIELTNSKLFYGPFFLTKRSDPRAVRGERLFVQTCMACHDNGQRKKDFALTLIMGDSHKPVAGLPKFSVADAAALKAYFKTIESEVATPAPKTP